MVRISARAVPALRGVEVLVIPPEVEAFYGLNRFENLRVVEYGGTADVFAFQDSLDWLTEKLADEEAFLFRLATNAIGARPISPALTAITAPHMRPIHTLAHWEPLMAALDERAANGTVRQDTSRENIFLCQGYAQLKRLEYAFYVGLSLAEAPYSPEIDACYRPGGPLHRRGAADLRAGPAAGPLLPGVLHQRRRQRLPAHAAQGALSGAICARICPWRTTTPCGASCCIWRTWAFWTRTTAGPRWTCCCAAV